MSSPPASGWGAGSHADGSEGRGASVGGAYGAGSVPAAAAPSVAMSDISRLSVDSHHSLHSQRTTHSRWSIAATAGTYARQEPAEPVLEELSSSSHASGDAAAATDRRPAGASRHTLGGRSGDGGSGSPGGAAQAALADDQQEGGTAGASVCSDMGAGPTSGGGGAADDRLPPRLIVFHPDGSTFGIGVDKSREAELRQATEEAARRRRQQQRAAAAEGVGTQRDEEAGPSSRQVDFDESHPGWRRLFSRQKRMLLALLLLDIAYLATLLALRLVWGNDGTEPQLSGAQEFFVGSHPETTSISYLAGAMFTDGVALYGAVQNHASIITLLIVWSVVLGAFAILEMPLLFIVIRLVLLVAAFQLRFSMARLRNMLPPTSLATYFHSVGTSVASTAGATWSRVSRPFRRHREEQTGAAAAPGQLGAAPSRRRSARAGTAPRVDPASSQMAAAQSALFRAALMRMMSEQRGVEAQRGTDSEASRAAGGSSAQLVTVQVQPQLQVQPQEAAEDADVEQPDRSISAGSTPEGRSGPRPGGSSAGAGSATPAVPGTQDSGSGSLGRLYSQIMDDIAAVAAAPGGSTQRRQQRQRDRERAAAAVAAGPDGAGSSMSAPQRPSALPGAEWSMSAAEQEEEDMGGPFRRRTSSATRRPRHTPSTVARAAAAAERSVAAAGGAGSSEGTASWPAVVALLAYHTEQQQLRRQHNPDVVPLVTLTPPELPEALQPPPPLVAPPAEVPAPAEAGTEDAGAGGEATAMV